MGATDRKTLIKARDALELTVVDESDGEREFPSPRDEKTAVVRFQAGRYDRESVRAAVRSDPEFAQRLAHDILAELKELGLPTKR